MDIQIFLQIPNQKIYELSDIVTRLSWATSLDAQPGKVRFAIPQIKGFDIPLGSTISIRIDNTGIFYGYIFESSMHSEGMIDYTAYDQLRYLKNKETYIFSGKTATEIFKEICEDWKLKYKIVDDCSWQVSSRAHDGKTLYQIIDYGYKEALVNTQNYFIIRDNYGTLEQISLLSLKTNLLFTDLQNISRYNYKKSIDKNSYNRVKLVQDNTSENVRKIYVAQDEKNQANWGILQYYEKVNKNATEQQIKERAESLLKIKNRETRSLSLTCVAAPHTLQAGNWVFLEINPLVDAGFVNYQDYIITHCNHTWKNNEHFVRIEVSKLSLTAGV